MVQFKELYLKGFCSISELELSLDSNQITVIRGATGTGKSQILMGLVWVLYGKNIKADKNVKNRKAVNNVNTWKKYRGKDYQGTIGSVYWQKGTELHKVTRCQSYKGDVNGSSGKDRLIYEIDAQEVTERKKGEIQALIEENLGISPTLFMNSILFGQGLTRLVKEAGTDQKLLFEEIFDLGYITEARKVAKKEYDKYNSRLVDVEYELGNLKVKKDAIKGTIKSLNSYREDFNKDKEQKLTKLNAELESAIKIRDKQLSKRDTKLYQLTKKKLEDNKRKTQEYRDKIKQLKSEANISLEEFIDEVIELIQSDPNSALDKLISTKKVFIDRDKYNRKLSTSQNRNFKILETLNRLEEIEEGIGVQEYKIEILKQDILRVSKEEPRTGNLDKNRKELTKVKSKIKETKVHYDSIKYERELYKWMVDDPLGNNGLKTFLFESSLDSLNEVLDSYSQTLGFHIQFIVNLESAKKDFEVMINMEGVEVEYEELSGGQKQLVNLAIAFAMNHIISLSKGVNIAFLDEVFEGLDRENIDIVINLIRDVYRDKTLFLITHQDSLPIPNSKTLYVTREKGLSIYNK